MKIDKELQELACSNIEFVTDLRFSTQPASLTIQNAGSIPDLRYEELDSLVLYAALSNPDLEDS